MGSNNVYSAQQASVWPTWNQQYAQAANVYVTGGDASCVTTWNIWNQVYVFTSQTTAVHFIDYGDIESPAAIAAHKVSRQRRESADAQADRLLGFVLSEAQRKQYKRDRAFDVIVGRTGETRRYRIKYGWAGNVYVIDERGREIEKLCIHPDAQIPIADNLIAQKLLLESNEAEFRRIANKTRLAA